MFMKFRGQTRKLGERVRVFDGAPVKSNWVYGTGVCFGNGDFSIIYGDSQIDDANNVFEKKHVVYSETVGLYTGIKTLDGVELYTGDILKTEIYGFDCLLVIKFGEYEQDGSGDEYPPVTCNGFYIEVIKFNSRNGKSDLDSFPDFLKTSSVSCVKKLPYDYTYMGNIFDNADLVE